LEEADVDVVFGLPGVHNLPIWEALKESPIDLIRVRHEQTAAYAADGYNRATGKLGVALVTTGPGAANTAGAIGEAMASGSSVLLVATEIPSALRRPGVYRGVLHESRGQSAIFRPITKQASVVSSADSIGSAIRSAGAEAGAAPGGPVYLGIPADFLTATVSAEDHRRAVPTGAVPELAADLVAEAIALLRDAERPLLWAGSGALRSGCGPQLSELAAALGAPIVTTFGARGIVPPDDPAAAPGPVHSPAVGSLWDEADLVVAVGTDFDGMMTHNWAMPRPPRLIAVNVDPADAAKNYVPDVTLVADAATALDRLLAGLGDRGGAGTLSDRLESIAAMVDADVATDEPQAAEMLDLFDRTLPEDAIVVADMCIPGYWLAGYRRVLRPRKLAYPMGWGTLGFSFPAAIGAAAAGAGPVVCVCGDGSFLFACGELATVAQERLPVTVVVVDDEGYGMLRYDQERAGPAGFGVDLVSPDFAALARSFGVAAECVDGFGAEFGDCLADAIGADGPRVIVVRARLKPPRTTSPRWYRRSGT
jgi:acetolactate synthase-1/2/3 large subunit